MCPPLTSWRNGSDFDMAHVPTVEKTGDLALLPFREALEASLSGRSAGASNAVQPSLTCDYDRGKWLYVPDCYDEYRYILGTRGAKPLICIGINPSTARPDALDNTLKSVERIALGNGYDSFLMMNVYAQRATDPQHMEQAENPFLHKENLQAFRYVLSLAGETPAVWAAWGTIVKVRPYLLSCMADFVAVGEELGAQWFTAGARSKKGGHPHHPLYLRKDAALEPFDAADYVRSLAI